MLKKLKDGAYDFMTFVCEGFSGLRKLYESVFLVSAGFFLHLFGFRVRV